MLITVNIYLGANEDARTPYYQIELSIIPMVGDTIELWSNRNSEIGYIGRFKEKKFGGTVTKIKHVIEEQGEDVSTLRLNQYIEIYLELEK